MTNRTQLTLRGSYYRTYLVQARDTGRFKDVHEFPRRRQAKAYIRGLVREWAEDPREFRIVTVRRSRR